MRWFEWDEAKHGVSFEAATLVFNDIHALEWIEEDIHHEERWKLLGMARNGILFVVYVERDEGYFDSSAEPVIRIISARRATRHEQERYKASR